MDPLGTNGQAAAQKESAEKIEPTKLRLLTKKGETAIVILSGLEPTENKNKICLNKRRQILRNRKNPDTVARFNVALTRQNSETRQRSGPSGDASLG